MATCIRRQHCCHRQRYFHLYSQRHWESCNSTYEGHSKSYLPDHLTITLAFCFWHSIIDYLVHKCNRAPACPVFGNIPAQSRSKHKTQVSTSKHKTSPAPVKFRVQPSAGKVMATVFWDCYGILLVEYTAHKSTITAGVYLSTLKSLRDAVKEKCRGFLSCSVMLLLRITRQTAIAECGFQEMNHPLYSPDLAPCDYFLFRHLKKHLWDRRFSSDTEVQADVTSLQEG